MRLFACIGLIWLPFGDMRVPLGDARSPTGELTPLCWAMAWRRNGTRASWAAEEGG